MTHFATADEPEGENAAFMAEQLLRFRAAVAGAARAFPGRGSSTPPTRPPRCASPRPPSTWSAAASRSTAARPFGGDPADDDLRPAMSLVSYLASVKTLRSRESVGLRPRLAGRARHARRRWCRWATPTATPAALVGPGRGAGGRPAGAGGRHDLDGPAHRGPRPGGAREGVGEEVVLIGRQGGERITRRGGRGLARHDQLRGDLRRRGRACRGSTRGERASGPRAPARPARAPRRRPGRWGAACATR